MYIRILKTYLCIKSYTTYYTYIIYVIIYEIEIFVLYTNFFICLEFKYIFHNITCYVFFDVFKGIMKFQKTETQR